MLNTSIDCIKVVTPDGRLVALNKSGCLALGVPEDSDFGMEWLGLLPDDVRSDGCNALQLAAQGKVARFPGRSQIEGEAPRHWDNVLTPVLNARGEAEIVLCLSRDVTTQRELEEQLRVMNRDLEAAISARTAELARLWNTSPDWLIVLSADGSILRTNPACKAILGYMPDEIVGRSLTSLAMVGDAYASVRLSDCVANGSADPIEIEYLHKDGSRRWIAWIAAVAGPDVYAIGRHVTQTKEAQAQLHLTQEALRHAHKLEAMGQLTGSVAHDFNNLLSIIRTSLRILKSENASDNQKSRSLDVVESTTERAISVTRQLLDFARRSPFAPTEFCVDSRVSGLMDMLAVLAGGSIEIVLEGCDGACRAFADPNQFDTAIVNLATNARDAMKRAGRLVIRIRATNHARASWRRQVREGHYVAVSVIDSGPGIPKEHLDQIFEPYFTTKEAGLGTGLGLPQVVGFAEQSGGAIEVSSTIGLGTTFTLYLPRAEGASLPAP